MKLNIKKKIVTFFILLVTFVIASEKKIPNIMVLDNPAKEITTIEGVKNREAAEVNISVKKRNVDEISGIETSDGIIFILPERSLSKNEDIKVIKTLKNILLETKNKQRNRNKAIIENPSIIIENGEEKIVKISKEDAKTSNYILIINKETEKVKKVFKTKYVKNSAVTTLSYQINNLKVGEKRIMNIENFPELSFFNENEDNIKIYKDGIKISTDGKASFNINGNEFDILFEQKSSGELLKPYIVAKKIISSFEVPIRIEAWSNSKNLNKKLKIINLNLSFKSVTEIGSLTFNMDTRLKTIKQNWVGKGGMVADNFDGGNPDNYPVFLNITGGYNNPENTRIVNVISVVGRPYKKFDNYGGYQVFLKSENDWSDEIAIPVNVPLADLEKKMVISLNNSNSDLLESPFTIECESGQRYSGSIIEKFVGEEAHDAIGKVDLTALPLGEWSRWNSTAIGKTLIESTEGETATIRLFTGKFFNWKSTVNSSGKHIVTKLVVENQDGIVETITSGENIGQRLQTTKFSANRIGIDTEEGALFIHKDSNSKIAQNYKIEIYYKDILLGKLNLRIVNNEPVETKVIGEVELQIDKRLAEDRNRPLNWIGMNGSLRRLPGDNPLTKYKLIGVIGEFSNLENTQILEASVQGRFFKTVDVPGYQGYIYRKNSSDNKDPVAVPVGNSLNELNNNILISKHNSNDITMLNAAFELIGANNKRYIGNIKKKYMGDSAENARGEVELDNIKIGEEVVWNEPGGTGELLSTNGKSIKLNILNGKLFNWKSATNLSGDHIVTRLKVTNTKTGIYDEADTETGVLLDVNFEKNMIGIGENGGLKLIKKVEDNSVENYDIEIYHYEILLGKLNLTVTNNAHIDIGSVDFQIDKRLQNTTLGNWIGVDGSLRESLNTNVQEIYSEFVNLKGNFSNLESTLITDIISIEGRPIKNDNISGHIMFIVASGVLDDESSMPININLNNLKNSLIISKRNSNDLDMLNNKFKLKGTERKIYSGNVKEKFVGEDAQEAIGTLDLHDLPVNEVVIWENPLETGDIISSSKENIIMRLSSGKLFNWKSSVNEMGSHIVTRLIIKDQEENIEETLIAENNSIGQKLETTKFSKNKIGIDVGTGGIFISKRAESTIPKTYEIEAYYKDTLLGKLELTIINSKYSFEIVGDNFVDLGALIQGQSRKIEGDIIIKNLGSGNIINVELNNNKPIKILKKDNSSIELPVVGDVSSSKTGVEIPVKINLTVTPEENQPPGEYEGDINLYIDIE